MTEFTLWFAYYDSLFLSPEIRLSRNFFQDHHVSESSWLYLPCPYIAQVFEYLENFIKDNNTWVACQCSLSELEAIQSSLDQLMQFIQLEKSYAYLFWERDSRRIEASMVHFYTFLQMLVRALIPESNMTVFQCRMANKLCIELPKLQKLMNQILKCVNPIANFLSRSQFAEEDKILTSFFHNLVSLMKKMPSIRQGQLSHIHSLAKFIALTNPIEICTGDKHRQLGQGVRKKSNTMGAKLKQNSYPVAGFRQSSCAHAKQTIIRERGSFSCMEFSRSERRFAWAEVKSNHKVSLFAFPKRILQRAKLEQNRRKNTAKCSATSLANDIGSISKNPTLATNETLPASHLKTNIAKDSKQFQQRKRTKARSYFEQNSPCKGINGPSSNTLGSQSRQVIRGTRFYEQECERDSEGISLRTQKQSTIRKKELSIVTLCETQRKTKMGQEQTWFNPDTADFCLTEGIRVKSKWALVRGYVHERIRLRKLKSLLS